jgi:hypothetical protein
MSNILTKGRPVKVRHKSRPLDIPALKQRLLEIEPLARAENDAFAKLHFKIAELVTSPHVTVQEKTEVLNVLSFMIDARSIGKPLPTIRRGGRKS